MVKRKRIAKTPAPLKLGMLLALIWLLGVIIFHSANAFQEIKMFPSVFLRLLTVELKLGPHFLSFWGAHLPRLVSCLGFFLGMWATGSWIMGYFIPNAFREQDEMLSPVGAVAALGCGIGIWAYLAFLLLALQIAWGPLLQVLFYANGLWGATWAFLRLRARSDYLIPQGSWRVRLRDPLVAGVAIVFVAGFLISLLGTTVPETSYDALVYHLTVPQRYLEAGRIVDFPYIHYSKLPLLTSLIYFWGLAAGGMFAAKILNFLLGTAIIAAFLAWGSKQKSPDSALIACALWLGTPLTAYLYWATNSDLGAAFFHLAALMVFWEWYESRRLDRLCVAGILGGFALASKYTTALGLAVMVFACAVICFRRRSESGFKPLAILCSLLILPLIPWWIRNFVFTGNPLFPYLVGTLGGANSDPALLQAWFLDARGGSGGLNIISHAQKVWSDATRGFEEFVYYFVGPLFLGLLPLVQKTRSRPWHFWAAVYCMVTLLLGFCTTYVTRYLLIYFAPLCFVLAQGLTSVTGRIQRWGFAVAVTAGLVLNLYWTSGLFLLSHIKGLSIATGKITPQQYLRQGRDLYPSPSYAAFEHIERLGVSPEQGILVVGDSRTFYAKGRILAAAQFNTPPLFHWAKEAGTLKRLNEKLIAENYPVILYNPHENQRVTLNRFQSSRILGLIVAMIEKYYVTTYEDAWTRVYVRKEVFTKWKAAGRFKPMPGVN